MINLIPTAKVIFRDGHEEDATSIFPMSEQHFIVCTKSGAYRYKNHDCVRTPWFTIYKYHPEHLVVYPSASGDSGVYDHSNCWIVDDSVKNIVVNWGE